MPKLTVNGQEVEFTPGMTVLQACELAGEEIPRFCYHERLKIAGNCRMCLVQIEGGPPKPAASCAMPAGDGMVVHTNSEMVKKAREGVMEFLLINHPLDCPICDQGGECDLQDQSMAYGRGSNRFEENKRGVKDKYMGPLIKPHMTRCIHCTRCIRFLDDIAGVPDMGATGRGEDMEVGTFIEKGISSELSGNIIDLCPVGALTSKPYAFKARSWELRKTESIDVLDAVGSSIRVDARGNEVMRILPRLNEAINEEWISDKTRFSYDGLKLQRLDRPMIRVKGKLEQATWDEAFNAIAEQVKGLDGKSIGAIAGDLADAESMLLLKEIIEHLGSGNHDCRQDGAALESGDRGSYLFNTTIAGIEEADACLLIGTNPRFEAPLVNARLRKRALKGNFPVASIAPEMDLTYELEQLGDDPSVLESLISGKGFGKILKSAEKPMVVVGAGVLTRKDAPALLALISTLCKKLGVVTKEWNGFNILHQAASRVGGLDVGFVPSKGAENVAGMLAKAKKGTIKFLYLLGADEFDTSNLKNTFVVYQGHHGDAGAHVADVILPGAAYTEKNATYVNLEGRVQRTRRAVFAPGEAQEDWKILIQLAERLNLELPYKTLRELRAHMANISESFAHPDHVVPAEWKPSGSEGIILKEPVKCFSGNFYMTDPISRVSQTMANCVDAFVNASKTKRKKRAA